LIFAGVPTLTLCTLGSYETKTKRKDNDIVPVVDPKRQNTENEGLRKTQTRRRTEPKKEEKQKKKNMQGNHLSKMGIAPLISCRLRSLVPLGTCLEKEYEKRMHIVRDKQECLG
jgi:hypothetical protein